jgi:hypothetical protein
MKPDLEGAAGMSFDLALFRKSRISYLMAGRFFQRKDINDYKNILQSGPEILFLTRPFEKLGISLDLSYLGETENIPYLRFNSKINYEVMRNFDIQLQANDLKDYQANLVHSFIF